MVRIVCVIAMLCAAWLSGCSREESRTAPAAEQSKSPAVVQQERPVEAAPRPAPPPRPNGGKGEMLKKSFPRPPIGPDRSSRGNGGTPAVVGASPALGADRERMRKRDDYVAGLSKAAYTFNPPTPIKVARPIAVALWVDPAKEAAQLAEEMKKAFPESAARVEPGTTVWSPRMKAALTGPTDLEITPLDPGKDGKPFDGEKDLSMTGRTEWSWSLVPTLPGTKKLQLRLSVVLPRELGDPHELQALERDVDVEITVWWLIDHYWERWKWAIGGIASALAAAIGWWFKRRFGGGK